MVNIDIDNLLFMANFYFNKNDYSKAVPILQKILSSQANNSKANELLAYINGNKGDLEEAHSLLVKACQEANCSPLSLYYLGKSFLRQLNFEDAILNLELSLQKGGDFFEALLDLGIAQARVNKNMNSIESFKRALIINKNSHILYFNMAKVYSELGNPLEALINYDNSLLVFSNFSQAWYNKGILLNSLKRIPEAIECFDKAIEINPNYTDAWLNKGVILNSLRRYNEAINCYLNTIRISPNISKSWSEYGVTLFELKLYEDALLCFDKAIVLEENFIEALINKGNTLVELRLYDAANVCFDKVLAINPNNSEAWTNKGVLFHCLRKYNDSLECYLNAIELNPNFASAWSNYGVTLIDLKKYKDSLKYFYKAILLDPDYADAHTNLSFALFNLGKFKQAWEEYDWRFKTEKLRSKYFEPKLPTWNGEKNLNTLFIWSEQGIGDQILYSSVYKELNKFPQNIIASINDKLIPIFSRSFPDITFISNSANLNDFELHEQIPIGSIPKYFRKSFDDFKKSDFPYLIHDKIKTNYFIEYLKTQNNFLCGLSLKSFNNDLVDDKSIPFDALKSLIMIDTISFVNLQNTIPKFCNDDLSLNSPHNLLIKQLDGVDLFNDIDSLASTIMACDIVITGSNSIAHLSGALNKVTYLLLPFASGRFWYWNEYDGKCLWYPSVKIFHQEEDLSWDKSIELISQNLINFSTSNL